MTTFDSIGITYNNTRQADERIVDRIMALLNLPAGSQIADIGAGTGNYSRALAESGMWVKAVEPSSVMIHQAQAHKYVEWMQGAAEQIPLGDASVDGVVSILAVCHFSDIRGCFNEMARINRTKSVVIFTFDCDAGRHTWMYDYFPFFWDLFEDYPSPQQQANLLGGVMECDAKIEPFLLPPDFKDGFAAAMWQQPWKYLDDRNRENISSFIKAESDMVVKKIHRLADDLESGKWEKQYGNIMQAQAYDAGYRFIYTC